MNDAVHADPTPLRRCCRFACVVAALAAGALIAAVPHRARAQESAANDRCPAAVLDAADAAHPPFNFTPVLLRVLEPSIEPVPATDGLIHLAYVAQVTNTAPRTAEILDVVAVDPLAGFAPTGRNIEVDTKGNDVTGKVKQFLSTTPPDPELEPTEEFSTNLGPRAGGTMLFDVTYTDPAQIPRLLAHAITLAPPLGTKSGVPRLTNPVPVGCVPLALLHPPLVGKGWIGTSGCCTTAAYHRDTAAGFNGDLMTGEVFAIDFEQIGTNNSCCNGPPEDVNSWWAYGKPVLAAAPGVVVEAVDGFPDKSPVGAVKNVSDANATGNHVIEDIGNGHYVYYAHFMRGSIPKGGVGQGRCPDNGAADRPRRQLREQRRPALALRREGPPDEHGRHGPALRVRHTAASGQRVRGRLGV
jgi:hypothetical protein